MCIVIIWNDTKFVLFIFGTCKTLHKCPELYRNRYASWVFCRLLKDDDRWKVDLQLGKFSVACVRMFGNCQKLRERLNFECSLRPALNPRQCLEIIASIAWRKMCAQRLKKSCGFVRSQFSADFILSWNIIYYVECGFFPILWMGMPFLKMWIWIFFIPCVHSFVASLTNLTTWIGIVFKIRLNSSFFSAAIRGNIVLNRNFPQN